VQSDAESLNDGIAIDAADWLARRDRGMTAAEQDDYLQWLRADPRHVVALNQIERGWQKLNRLSDWRPSHSQRPNPDLLAPRRRLRPPNFGGLAALLSIAACAALAIGLFLALRPGTTEPRQAILHPGPERVVLEDGSVVELKPGAAIDVEFTATARNVRLREGEGYFAVAKDPARPFVVTAGAVDVRAVGTEFCVTLNLTAVSVLVTEGRVQLDKTPQLTAATTTDPVTELSRELSQISAGQQAIIQLEPVAGDGSSIAAAVVEIRDITPAEIDRALAWQSMRLEFIELPLRDVVREFNRFNVRKLVIADDNTGEMQVGGSFRADNVDSFVRLLVTGFGMTAESRGDEIVLHGPRGQLPR
jgi:transmembrane sensor